MTELNCTSYEPWDQKIQEQYEKYEAELGRLKVHYYNVAEFLGLTYQEYMKMTEQELSKEIMARLEAFQTEYRVNKFKLDTCKETVTKMAGHEMMQVAGPAQELLNKLK